MKKSLILPLVLSGMFAFVASTQAAASLGDPAAALSIAEWVKGKQVDLAAGKGKKIFVVEFWATWCPPCRDSIPHLTELQKKFQDKDVVFIGISDETSATVKKFVDKMGDKMDYVVAIDDNHQTSTNYMQAYGINGIPHAFIVAKDGRLVWHGHPMGDLEKTLKALLAGKYDLETAKKRSRAESLLEEFTELVASGKDDAKADQLGKELEALDKELGGIVEGQKFNAADVRKQAQFQSVIRQYMQAMRGGDADKLAALEKKIEAVAPSDFKLADFKAEMSFQSLFGDYFRLITRDTLDEKKATDLTQKILALPVKNAQMLNQVAWALLSDERVKQRDLPFALKLAKAAYDVCEGKEAAVVDTYARALFDNGKFKDAVTYQKQAIKLTTDADMRADLEKTLKRYEEKAK